MIKSPITALATALVLASSLCAQQDQVTRRNGAKETGTIEAENYDGVMMKARQGNQEKNIRIPLDDVVSVSYGGDAEYRAAVALVSTGNLAGAIPKLTELSKKESLRKLLKPLVLFQLGSAQERAGQYAQAATTQLDLIKAHPKTRWLIPAVQSIVDCHLALGNAAAGTTAVEEAATVAASGGVDASYLTMFDYFRARLFEAQKNLISAKVKFQSAAAASTALGSLAAMARLGLARCEQAEGKAAEAQREFTALTQLDSSNEVLAGAWNGLAELALAKGAHDKSIEQVMNAMYMYLRGVVEFAPAPGEPTGEYERALAGAGQAFKNLADLETDETKKKQFEQRSRHRLDQLKKELPNSRYLAK